MLGEGDGLVGLTGRAIARAVHDEHLGRAPRQLERGLDRLGQALADVVAPDEAVDDDLDRVHLVAGQVDLGPLRQLEGHPVDPDPGEALLGQVVEERAVLALAAPHDRGQHLEAGPLGQLEDPVDDLLGRLAGHRPAAGGAMGMPDAGVEQPQVVVDLGDGPDRRAGVARGGLLVDGDGRREPFDEVDVGLVHLAQELAGVRREGLDVAALALGVDGVEGQRRLARPRQPGEDDQPVPGQVEGDVTQIVLASPANDQTVGHLGRIPARCVTSGGILPGEPGPAAGSMRAGPGRPAQPPMPTTGSTSGQATRRAVEGRVAVVEDAAVGGDQPVAVPARGARPCPPPAC